jgi:hypothetical protein
LTEKGRVLQTVMEAMEPWMQCGLMLKDSDCIRWHISKSQSETGFYLQSVEKVGRQEKVHEECELFLFFFSSIW